MTRRTYEQLRRQKHAKHGDWTSRAPKHWPRTGLPPKPTPRAVLAVPVAATIRISEDAHASCRHDSYFSSTAAVVGFFFLPISAAPPLLSLGR
jgi:hypothetical protein